MTSAILVDNQKAAFDKGEIAITVLTQSKRRTRFSRKWSHAIVRELENSGTSSLQSSPETFSPKTIRRYMHLLPGTLTKILLKCQYGGN